MYTHKNICWVHKRVQQNVFSPFITNLMWVSKHTYSSMYAHAHVSPISTQQVNWLYNMPTQVLSEGLLGKPHQKGRSFRSQGGTTSSKGTAWYENLPLTWKDPLIQDHIEYLKHLRCRSRSPLVTDCSVIEEPPISDQCPAKLSKRNPSQSHLCLLGCDETIEWRTPLVPQLIPWKTQQTCQAWDLIENFQQRCRRPLRS